MHRIEVDILNDSCSNTRSFGICENTHHLTGQSPAGICILPSIECLEVIIDQMETHQHNDKTCTSDTCLQPTQMFLDIGDTIRKRQPIEERTGEMEILLQ